MIYADEAWIIVSLAGKVPLIKLKGWKETAIDHSRVKYVPVHKFVDGVTQVVIVNEVTSLGRFCGVNNPTDPSFQIALAEHWATLW